MLRYFWRLSMFCAIDFIRYVRIYEKKMKMHSKRQGTQNRLRTELGELRLTSYVDHGSSSKVRPLVKCRLKTIRIVLNIHPYP